MHALSRQSTAVPKPEHPADGTGKSLTASHEPAQRPARPAAPIGLAPTSRAPRREPDDRLPLALLYSVPLVATVVGLPYYLLDPAQRLRSPLHPWLKPSGTIGLVFGIAGLTVFLFMWLYSIRKKARWLAWAGPVGSWLRVHILAGLVLPFLVAVHAGWRFEGLIGLGYWAMVLVALSGVVGRYLYSRIPRSQSGLELTLDDAATERRTLLTRIAVTTGLDPRVVERSLAVDASSYAGLGPAATVRRMIADDLARWKAMATLRRQWKGLGHDHAIGGKAIREALRLARREMALAQQMRMLEATRRVFGLWHVAHRPFALTALLAVLVHVAVAISVGAVLR